MNTKADYERTLQVQLDTFETQITNLKARANRAEANTRPWSDRRMDTLQEKHRLAREKLDELRDASDDAWEDLKAGIASAWDSVGDALKSAARRFE